MFGGFKASLNFFGKQNKRRTHSELSPDMTVSGAYRTSRDDSFGYRNSFEQNQKSAASEELAQQMRPTKSAVDLSKVRNVPPHLRHSSVEVSRDPRGASQDDPRNGAQNPKVTKNQEKEQKRLEKQRLAEQKAREKQAQEQAKQERLRREKEKKDAQPARPDRKRERKPDRKKMAPQPQTAVPAAAAPAATVPAAPVAPKRQQYSTDTLESSISRSSGPPPYSDVPRPGPGTSTNAQSQNNTKGNVIYSKPVDTGSWDMISHHRQQTIRPTTVIGGGGNKNKQMVMDLNYNFGATSEPKENSEA